MNSSQMLITMGAMFLLGLVILRVNNSFLSTSEVLLNSKYNIVAISLASSLIEEANSKAFDENTVTGSVSTYASITEYNALGPDAGESLRVDFDDFDDFNGFAFRDTFVVDSLLLGYFDVYCTVEYVDVVNPDSGLTSKSWNKNFKVTVKSDTLMTDSVVMSTIYSYWYFR